MEAVEEDPAALWRGVNGDHFPFLKLIHPRVGVLGICWR